MQVTTEQIDPCKMALTISVEAEKVEAAKEKAFRQFAQSVQVPGFRKGKVPAQMARAYVDPSRIKQRAAELLVEPAYKEAVEESKIEPFAEAELEMVEMEDEGPFVFKAFVPLRPVVTLGLYKGLALERRRLQVTDEDVEKQIEEILTRQAEYPEISDRTAQTGDILLAGLTAEVEGQEIPDLAEPRDTVIEIGKNIPDFDAALVGMAIGETKTVDALYPEEFADENLRGKRATFTVSVKEVRAKVLPELNDELVQKIHPTAKTVEELKNSIRENLEKAADEMADNELEFRLVGEVVKTSQIFFPDVLLRAEMQADAQQISERLERDKITLENYLDETGKTREQLEKEIAAGADVRIRNSLALSEVARTDAISVEDADVDAVIAERAERARVSPAAVRAFAEKNDQLGQIRDQALTRKILAHLKGLSTVTDKFVTTEELAATAGGEAEATQIQDLASATEVAAEAEGAKKQGARKQPSAKKTDETEAEPTEAVAVSTE
ncbi:MAG: trigger factor [Cytophagales bacterium]|nr:trigger factor [Armatimonadota bacterium]